MQSAAERLFVDSDEVRRFNSKLLLCDVMHNWDAHIRHKKKVDAMKTTRKKQEEAQKLKEIEVIQIQKMG